MKKTYRNYVFDTDKKEFIGAFDDMYKNEQKLGYDSWNQEDLRDLGYLFSLSILNQYNFDKILDIGCGKGLFTSLLKKKNNMVYGVDVSKTALRKATTTYSDIRFNHFDANTSNIDGQYDLIIIKEVLSYIKNWKDLILVCHSHAEYLFISLDLPNEPIGFVKSFNDLEAVIWERFDILTSVCIKSDSTPGQHLYLCKRRYL